MTGGASRRAEVRVLDLDAGPELPIVASAGSARAVVWPGIGAELRSLHRIGLDPGGETIELAHPGEAVYYVISGDGEVADGTTARRLTEGAMIHVEPGTAYRLRAGPGGLTVIGGPAPADPALYATEGR
jgi:quercetin dioxygenase-like cupin family protein